MTARVLFSLYCALAAAATMLTTIGHAATGWVKIAAIVSAAVLCGVSLRRPCRLRAFLFAYLLFAIGLLGMRRFRRPHAVFIALAVLAGGAQYYSMKRITPELVVPVIFYLCVGLLLAFSGFAAYLGSGRSVRGRAYLAAALLLYLSDSVIGLNMFTTPVGRLYQPIVLLPYYAGLGLLMAAAILMSDRRTSPREARAQPPRCVSLAGRTTPGRPPEARPGGEPPSPSG
jgi:hypothetical protein